MIPSNKAESTTTRPRYTASPRRAAFLRPRGEAAAASAMLTTFFRDVRTFSGSECALTGSVQDREYRRTQHANELDLHWMSLRGLPRIPYKRTSENAVTAKFAEIVKSEVRRISLPH